MTRSFVVSAWLALLAAGAPAFAQCPGGVCRPQSGFFGSPLSGGTLFGRDEQATTADAEPHPAVVRISNFEREGTASLGSGTLVATDQGEGLVLSCAHLFREGVGRVQVRFADGRQASAELLAVDQVYDLSALRIRAPRDAAVAPVAEQFSRQGERCELCGYGGGEFRLVHGQVRGYARPSSAALWQTMVIAAPARNGDSGGPILNQEGQVAAVLWGTDGQQSYGTCCLRIRNFLGGLAGRWGRRAIAKKPSARPTPDQGPLGGQLQDVAPGESTAPPDPQLQEKLAALAEQLAAVQSDKGTLADKLRALEGKLAEPAAAKLPPIAAAAPLAGGPVEKAAEGWGAAKISTLLVSLGVAGGPAALAGSLGAAAVWFVMRRTVARLKSQVAARAMATTSAPAPFPTSGGENSAVQRPPAEPLIIRRDSPPPPPIVERSREFVEVQVPSARLESLQWAMDELVRRYPGMRPSVEAIESFATQYESGLKKQTAGRT